MLLSFSKLFFSNFPGSLISYKRYLSSHPKHRDNATRNSAKGKGHWFSTWPWAPFCPTQGIASAGIAMMDVVPRLSFSLPGKEAAAHFHDQESQSRNCEARLEYLSLSLSLLPTNLHRSSWEDRLPAIAVWDSNQNLDCRGSVTFSIVCVLC